MLRIAAIGTFDGVHRGHRSLLKTLNYYAKEKGLEPVAITFRNHPLSHIAPHRAPKILTPLGKKKNLLVEMGVMPIVLEFNEKLRKTTAYEWMKQIRDEYEVKAIVLGYDNTFGCDGINLSLEEYKKLGKELDLEVFTAEEIRGVSSSSIRKAVLAGEMARACEMLGRPYSITAKVVNGNRLGHTIGFPTANLDVEEDVAVPKQGVYAAVVKILKDGTKHPAMVNIGTRPTVMRGDETVIEAHIINWKGDLYGQDITVRFLERLRDEKKFDSIEALKQQLREDKKNAEAIYFNFV